jgi:hypothetical protein
VTEERQMKTAADAKKWLAEFANWNVVMGRFLIELTEGLPDDAIIAEHRTDDEAQALLKRICDEERFPFDRAIEWSKLNPETVRQHKRQAVDLLGFSVAARRRLGLLDA